MSHNDLSKFHYLRFRPFLTINVTMHPQANVRTERKGWKDTASNLSIREHPEIVDRIAARHLSGCAIIIDILHGKLIKNHLKKTTEDMDLAEFEGQVVEHYMQKYADQIESGKNRWAASQMRAA